jgi:hypothetical protein
MKKTVFQLLLITLTMASAHAQEIRPVNGDAFSSQAVVLSFSDQLEGAEIGDLFSKWGVSFKGAGTAVPRIRIRKIQDPILPEPIPSPTPVLRNEATVSLSGSLPLIVDFKTSVRRVGFGLANGDSSTKATLRAFDSMGSLLGTVEKQGIAGGENSPTFVAFEATAPQGIAKVVIDYGSSPNAEEVDQIILDYVSSAKFTTYLAQVGDGVIGGGLRLQTLIVVSNLTDLPALGTLKLLTDNGSPLALVFNDGAAGSSFDFALDHRGSKTFITGGSTIPATPGYARIEANVPVESTAIFRTLDQSGNVVTEAGVGSAEGKVSMLGVVQKVGNGDFDSGVAIVNTSQAEAKVRLRLFEESVISAGLVTEFTLAAGEHRARFLSEIYPTLASRTLRGSILVTSDQSLAMVILRTLRGLPISSLPVGSTQK